MSTPLNMRHLLYRAPTLIKDPGYSATTSKQTITINKDGGVCPVVTTGTGDERTLRVPTKAGIIGTIVLYEDSGDLTLTVPNGYNNDADEDIIFDDEGDFVRFMSIDVGGTYYWRVIAQEGTDASTEEGIFDTATITALTLDSTLLTVTGAELNQMAGAIVQGMTPGTGISTGTNTICEGQVVKAGGMYKTEIWIDLTGLSSGATAGDIIGKSATASCHIGEITAAKNGTIFHGTMTCLETPSTGDDDIDLWGTATVGTGTQNVAISTLTDEDQLIDHGDWTGAIQTPYPLAEGLPGPGFLYLCSGQTEAAALYDGGQFLITLWGK